MFNRRELAVFWLFFGSMMFFVVSASLFAPSEAQQSNRYKIERVIDGDTVVISAKFLPHELGQVLSLRIKGVDTPESGARAKCDSEKELAQNAKQFVIDMIAASKSTKVILYGWDKYGGRVLGDIILNGMLISELLISNGYAFRYDGGTKASWC